MLELVASSLLAVQGRHFEAAARTDSDPAEESLAVVAQVDTARADPGVGADSHNLGERNVVEAGDNHIRNPVEAASDNLGHQILLEGLENYAVDADADADADVVAELVVAVAAEQVRTRHR